MVAFAFLPMFASSLLLAFDLARTTAKLLLELLILAEIVVLVGRCLGCLKILQRGAKRYWGA